MNKWVILFVLIELVNPIFSIAQKVNKIATITFHLSKSYAGDTLFSEYWPDIVRPNPPYAPINDKILKMEYHTIIGKNGIAQLKLKMLNQFGYFLLAKDIVVQNGRYQSLTDLYLLEAGDNIHIAIKSDSIYSSRIIDRNDLKRRIYHLSFYGTGASKFKWYYELSHFSVDVENYVPPFNKDGYFNQDNYYEYVFGRELSCLKGYKSKLNVQSFLIARADLVGNYFQQLGNEIYNAVGDSQVLKRASSFSFEKLIIRFRKGLAKFAMDFSKNYSDGVYCIESGNYRLSHTQLDAGFYDYLKTKYSGKVRDKLLTIFFVQNNLELSNPDSLLADGLNTIKDLVCRAKVKESGRKFKGSNFFDFKLERDDGETFSKSDLRNRVAIVDFWFTGCTGCSLYFQTALKDVEAAYANNQEIIFLSICLDADRNSWQKSIQKEKYTSVDSGNLINAFTNGNGFEHPLVKYYNINGAPTELVIDAKGKIFAYNDELRNKEYLIKTINEALKGN